MSLRTSPRVPPGTTTSHITHRGKASEFEAKALSSQRAKGPPRFKSHRSAPLTRFPRLRRNAPRDTQSSKSHHNHRQASFQELELHAQCPPHLSRSSLGSSVKRTGRRHRRQRREHHVQHHGGAASTQLGNSTAATIWTMVSNNIMQRLPNLESQSPNSGPHFSHYATRLRAYGKNFAGMSRLNQFRTQDFHGSAFDYWPQRFRQRRQFLAGYRQTEFFPPARPYKKQFVLPVGGPV